MDSVLNVAVPESLLEARSPSGTTTTQDSTTDSTTTSSTSSSTCASDNNSAACEKPESSSGFTVPIVLGVVIPVIGALVLFFFLHRRHVRKQREEDANDRHASMDFGLGDVPQPGYKHRQRLAAVNDNMDFGEKDGQSKRQVSLEMTVNSPYLLPPELHNSRESLHSLSRSIQQEDPYRPVTEYFAGDGASVHSYQKSGKDGSIYTGSSGAPSRLHDVGKDKLLSNAAAMSRDSPPGGFVPPPRQNSLPQKSDSPVDSISNSPLPPPPYPVEPQQAHLRDSGSSEIQRKGLPANPRSGNALAPSTIIDTRDSYAGQDNAAIRTSNNYLGQFINSRDPSPAPPQAPIKSAEREVTGPVQRSPPMLNSLPANPRPIRQQSIPAIQAHEGTFMDDESEYGDGFKVTPPSPGRENNPQLTQGRYSIDAPEQLTQAGLGAAGHDTRRLSMGFRPLPPSEAVESDDPEIRANRIRSFYKEYFDESKPPPQGGYYEDYDENYLGDVAYFDPDQGNFAMPYAQPVTRRAMTPPPRGPRFQGPRPRNGSTGAMSMGGMRPPGPRAFSSASGRMGPGQGAKPKRPFLPPTDLTSLPIPSKLRDDTFALNPIDFAPPPTYRDRAAGRSDSPLGERRPYSPAVPSFQPLVSAFDELAVMPSPHLLRKSGTFTGLDFAPPKKFRDPDAMSDAGSIRSNRSGVSAMQLGAIRNGAYRVSRLPQDAVFTKDDLAATLKPQRSLLQKYEVNDLGLDGAANGLGTRNEKSQLISPAPTRFALPRFRSTTHPLCPRTTPPQHLSTNNPPPSTSPSNTPLVILLIASFPRRGRIRLLSSPPFDSFLAARSAPSHAVDTFVPCTADPLTVHSFLQTIVSESTYVDRGRVW
ncbi:hypothetical protein B7494_g6917 [Chlorociboria aeruginascens]|nr:hypothetical protein B7494_g6917 [Chlorociboria aeruginascens]